MPYIIHWRKIAIELIGESLGLFDCAIIDFDFCTSVAKAGNDGS